MKSMFGKKLLAFMFIADVVSLPFLGYIILSLYETLRPESHTIVLTGARPGCPQSCGNISISFPFGVGAGCFIDPWFEVKCNASHNSNYSKPFLPGFHNLEVMDITIPNYNNQWLQSLTVGIPCSTISGSGEDHNKRYSIDLRGTPFNFSTDHNVFLMEGCPGSALLTDQAINKPLAGCSTACHNATESSPGSTAKKCYGDVSECCQMELPSEPSRSNDGIHFQNSPLQLYKVGFYGHSSGENSNSLAATLIKNDSVDKYIHKLSTSLQHPSIVPVLLYWSWVSNSSPDHNHNAHCWRRQNSTANITDCTCNRNSAGNPYVFNGCKRQARCFQCREHCIWSDKTSSYYCEDYNDTRFMVGKVFIFVAAALAPMLALFTFRMMLRSQKTYRRVKIFMQKLREQQTSNGVVGRTKLLTYRTLKRATDHFNQNRILGRGGQGTVYKGMLIDGTIVAVKVASKLEDESQTEQFLNELVILSTTNHRNVVKLLGCCLQTEVPLLVYEFISNGTLCDHIHHPNEDFVLTWAMRLKIAADSAGAIAYLHSSSSTPVYHRDIKTSNILLDEQYRAKVSDFGCSKAIKIDQTHTNTLVRGTFGYFDPEYFRSGIYTDKSDVYSFGVVLLELLTSKKPIYSVSVATTEVKGLVGEFFLHVESSNLLDLLDHEIVNEAKEEELAAVVDLAKFCLNESGRLRPTMREVASKLDMIIKPPTEMPTNDQRDSPNEEFSEISTPLTSETNIMSNPIPAQVGSPMHTDAHPLHNTI